MESAEHSSKDTNPKPDLAGPSRQGSPDGCITGHEAQPSSRSWPPACSGAQSNLKCARLIEMCRLFGFRSLLESGVHQSLIGADNALGVQSEQHPDGWGVAYYAANSPHVVKSTQAAKRDQLFHKVSGVVSSQCVVAHVRRATQGAQEILNTHPFQYGRWIFAHNGNLLNFGQIAPQLRRAISPCLARYVLGNTDSELIFYLLLTKLSQFCSLQEASPSPTHLRQAIEACVDQIAAIAGPLCADDGAEANNNFLTFALTDGRCMVVHEGGKALHLSTHKQVCSERDHCPHHQKACESPIETGPTSHFIVSSEPLDGDNVWQRLSHRSITGVDANMELFRYHWGDEYGYRRML